MRDYQKRGVFIYLNKSLRISLSKGVSSCKSLFVFMIPIMIITKVLQELDVLALVVYPFYPIMGFFDLPGVYALVWLGAILNTNYTAFYLILLLFPSNPITYEQLTVLSILCLVCHSLVIESVIIHKLKVKGWWSAFVRIFSAVVLGYLVHIFCSVFGILQDIVNNPILSQALTIYPPIIDYIKTGSFYMYYDVWLYGIAIWCYGQVKLFILIFAVISLIFFLVKLAQDVQLVEKIRIFIDPFFKMLGISKKNSFVTLVAYIIGLSYGWGVLKGEMNSNIYFRKDQAVKIATFLSIVHAIIEDTLLFSILGANAWILVIFRTGYAIIFGIILGRYILPKLSYKTKNKYLYN